VKTRCSHCKDRSTEELERNKTRFTVRLT